MDKTAIKNFAIWARNKLIADIQYRAGLMGITAEGIKNALPQSTAAMEFYDIGTAEPYSITGDAIRQRNRLVEIIRQKEKNSDYATAYKYILEEVAYTWFNRLIAIRFMEVNDYLPSHIRVLSSESGKVEPDLVTTPFDAGLSFTPAEEENILRLKTENELDELFRLLFIKQCNALNEILPALFEKTSDYTELLLNLSVVDQEGVVYHLINDIDEKYFDIEREGQIEIIGWLYQYYNTEPKNAAFAKNGKITKDEIPAVTQLFTPDWIVHYMVENSLGRIFIDKRKNEGVYADGRGLDEMTWEEAESHRIWIEKDLADQMGWKYYLPEAEQTKEVREQLEEIQRQSAYKDLRDIKVIDPCMGSGHILVYAFDVLMQMYEDAGYSQRDAAKSILEYNLYGLDIDDRAYQLAYFAVMMKARQYNRRILNGENTCHVYSIQESNNINRAHLKYFGAGMSELEVNDARTQLEGLLDTFIDAKEYGSILKVENYNWELLRRFVFSSDAGEQITMDSAGLNETEGQLKTLVSIGEVMARKYDVVVTNPPYMGSSGMGALLNEFVKKYYPDAKSDMSTVMMEKALSLCKDGGLMAMINIPVWMVLTSYEKFRCELIQNNTIINVVHPGRGIFGSDFGSVAFVIARINTENYNGSYRRLFENAGDVESVEERETQFISGKGQFFAKQNEFSMIPGAPIAYWVSQQFRKAFSFPRLGTIIFPKTGLTTGDNETYLKLWFEVSNKKIGKKWFYLNKGGEFRKWYGNNEYVLNWENNGESIKAAHGSTIRNPEFFFREGVTWSKITAYKFSGRFSPSTHLFDAVGLTCFANEDTDLMFVLAYFCSCVANHFLSVLNSTVTYTTGSVANLPFAYPAEFVPHIRDLAKDNVNYSQNDWDSFETSWDFKLHPLVEYRHSVSKPQIEPDWIHQSYYLKDAYQAWEYLCKLRFDKLKENEEELNGIFIDIYGLQDELTPKVEDKDVTVRKADLQRDIKSLLSYAVGCMFGRYSLDVDGLAYAGGEWDESKYKSFFPDADGVIPLTDEEYLEDDIVIRLCNWLKVVYGEGTLEENLDFIAKALGTKGDSSREIIRNYFLKDFFKDHCKIYQKRPIYWLFDSGKQNGFKALIYLHRYTPDTIGNLRVDYLHKMQRVYESEINRMQDMIDHSSNAREVSVSTKRKEKLQKQLKECRDYDEMIAHLALSRIELDLDDGVKVNYEKVQTGSGGKKYTVLAKI